MYKFMGLSSLPFDSTETEEYDGQQGRCCLRPQSASWPFCQSRRQRSFSATSMARILRDEPENPWTYPFQDPTLPWNQRVDDLVSRLSVEEIVPQTKAVYGGQTPAIPRLNIKPYIWISECLHGQTETNGTAFPMAIGLAATFR